ncbi:MAG: tryptophan synthase subunit alpha [Candidatus Omnitrophica bacterium]|nr:tryptophan synthase subunit alpha [Candidatus Omnitrophota bacterium]
MKNKKFNRIDGKFRQLRREKKKAFVAFITAADPNLSTTEKLALAFERLGVDILELGVPFSDPLADGPVIQAASRRALRNKVNLGVIFKLIKRLRKKIELPIVLLTYYNIIFHAGLKNFVQAAKNSGADGVVVPDLPVEEAGDLIKISKMNNFATIFLLAPTSSASRIKRIAASSTGFIYYVSLTGTTGMRKKLPPELISRLRQLKGLTRKPVCVGFGVSGSAQAKSLARVADGVIVGSAIIKVIEKHLGKKDLVQRVTRFVSSLRKAI